jgi:peptide/nickel transport system permease protein
VSRTGSVPGTGDATPALLNALESLVANESSSGPVPRRRWRGVTFFGAFVENKVAVASFAVVVLVVLFCFLGPVFYHTDQVTSTLALASEAPGAAHLLGTTANGYDELGRLMAGGQGTIEIAFAAAALASALGVLWGAISGYVGGIVDSIMMRIVDTFLALPVLFVLLLMAAIIKVNQLNLTLIVALFAWLVPARLIRGEALALRTREYVQAVAAMGGGSGRSIFFHIIPNSIGIIVVNITFQVATAILILATLGFLGFGIPPPATNWGQMLSEGVNYLYAGYWWLIYPVGALIIITVMAFNLIGDGLRDAFDVRLRRR